MDSTAISWILRTHDLPLAVTWVLAGFAVSNVLLGVWMAVWLMNDERAGR
jgi:hypothetical protein